MKDNVTSTWTRKARSTTVLWKFIQQWTNGRRVCGGVWLKDALNVLPKWPTFRRRRPGDTWRKGGQEG